MIAEATYLPIIIVFGILVALLVAGVIETRQSNDESVEIVACIESQEFFKALDKCKSLKPKKLLKYKDKILDAIKRRLNYCITYSTYKSGLYWIDLRTIREAYAYKGILKLFLESEEVLEQIEVVDKIIALEKFAKWNDYAAEDDEILSDVESFIKRGDSFKETSIENANRYYKNALTVCKRASLNFFDDRNYGFKETAAFYTNYAKIISCKIEGRNPSEAETLAFDDAKASYTRIYEEYLAALEEYADLIQRLPSSVD